MSKNKRFEHLGSIERRRVPENTKIRLRLHRNEIPNDWDADFLNTIYSNIPQNLLQRYPDSSEFYAVLAGFLGIDQENILVTSGIDEAIRNFILLNCDKQNGFFTNSPAYAMYQVYAKILGVDVTAVQPVPENFLSPSALISQIPKKTNLVFIANPSQPVENCFSVDQLHEIAKFCEKENQVLVIDEAYQYFGGPDAIPLINDFNNIAVMRSFSKAFGGASLRLGYIVGSVESLKELQAFRLAHEGNSFSYYIGSRLIEAFDEDVKLNIGNIIAGRNYFRNGCLNLGLEAWGEVGNFVMVRFKTHEQMSKIVTDLEVAGIFVKGHYPEPLESCITVTAGTEEMMREVLKVFQSQIKGAGS